MKKFYLIILALAGLLFSCTKDIDTTHESFENSSYNISYINQYLKEVETVSGNSANFDSISRY
ncbi:MAG: hypothetical protein PUB34_08120, partial [Clostridia bacterium]|nr:hypothetical protein [Clostridia bacterium]